MNPVRFSAHCALPVAVYLLSVIASALSGPSFAQQVYGQSGAGQTTLDRPAAKTDEPRETVRQVIVKPMMAAERLLADKKYQEALEQIIETEKVDGKTPYELYILDRMRATAALATGDDALAVKSLQSALASGRIPATDAVTFVDSIARIYYRQKDFKQAATWAARAVKEPGTRIEMRLLLGHSAYLTGDFATAKTEITAVVAAAELAGAALPEDQLRILASASLKANDTPAYVSALEKLVLRYPKREYWADLIYRVESSPGFAERFALDVYRLKLVTGVMSEKSDFHEMASLTLQSGYPTEAQKVIDAGIAAGVLAKDTSVDSEKKLRASIRKELAEEEKAHAASGNRLLPKSSLALLNNGFDSVLKGNPDRGLQMMEAAIKAADLRRPEDARLRYGIALVLAGQKPKASSIFKMIQGTDGAAALARLWDLFTQSGG